MIGKLAFKNMKKSMSDYAVYFVTLIIGISVFYVFNAISDQQVMIKIFKSEHDILDLLKETLSVASVVVSVVLAFLVVYASNFLMKRRKKEFGIYMLLGMGKKKIAGILMTETVIIGVISLAVGLIIGVVLSQGMSMLVASLFEADMSDFSFEISVEAMGKTIIYFLIMYAVVLLLDVFVVGKSRLIRLLNAEKRVEKNIARNPWICLIVFIAAAIVLGHAYYMVTAGAEELTTEVQLFREIIKGVVTTFLIFWSLSGLLIFLAKLRKKSYMRGINAFTTKEISSRVNTNVFAGSVICLMLFFTICIFSTCFSINKSMNDNLKTLVPADVNFLKMISEGEDKDKKGNMSPISDDFSKKDIDTGMFKDQVEALLYAYEEDTEEQDVEAQDAEAVETGFTNVFIGNGRVMKLSDYNKVAKIYGLEQLSLAEDEYEAVANYDYSVQSYNVELAKNRTVVLGGKEYHPRTKKCRDGFIEMSSNRSNLGFIVVPDDAVSDEKLSPYIWYYIANYNQNYKKDKDYIENYINSKKFEKKMDELIVSTREMIKQRSTGLTAMIVFLGLYLGIIFIIASSALLSLKELSQAADNRGKYRILRDLGVDEKMIHQSLLRQNLIFFGMPLLLAIVHSVFGIQVCVYIIEVFGKTGLLPSIIFTAVLLLAVYTIYFAVTYRCSRKIIDEQ